MFQINRLLSFVRRDTNIDSVCFKCHYIGLPVILLVSTALCYSKLSFGDPITCSVKGVESQLSSSYCWAHGTTNIPEKFDSFVTCPTITREREEKKNYYQYLHFIQVGQALSFLLPFLIWQALESGILQYYLQLSSESVKGTAVFLLITFHS